MDGSLAPPLGEVTPAMDYAGWWIRTAAALWVMALGALMDGIVLAADRRKQSLHDKAASTVVVRTR